MENHIYSNEYVIKRLNQYLKTVGSYYQISNHNGKLVLGLTYDKNFSFPCTWSDANDFLFGSKSIFRYMKKTFKPLKSDSLEEFFIKLDLIGV